MTVRCKFICMEIITIPGFYTARFIPVSSGSEENKRFWSATPSGKLELGTINEMPFEVGKEYYLDITLVE